MLQETRILPYGPAPIAEAAALIARGQPIAIPVETAYSLAADATSGEAVELVYEAKGRSSFNPLIVHVPDLPMAQTIGQFDAHALALAKAHWPGPLTLVVPLAPAHPLRLHPLQLRREARPAIRPCRNRKPS